MNRDAALGTAMLIFTLLLWAGNAVIARSVMVGDMPPLIFNFLRWALALVIILPFTSHRVWRQRHEILHHWRFLTVFGALTIAFFNSFLYSGLQFTTAVQGSLIMLLLPVLMLILVAVVLRQRITGRQILGLALSMGGAALILLRGDPGLLRTLDFNVGDLLCLAAVFIWSLQIFLMRWKPTNIDMPTFMTVIIAVGVAFQAPLAGWEMTTGRFFVPSTANLAAVGYVALFAAVIGTTIYNAGVLKTGPTLAGYLGNLYPLFAAALGVIFLGEVFEWFHAIGAVLVLAGIYLATIMRARTVRAAA